MDCLGIRYCIDYFILYGMVIHGVTKPYINLLLKLGSPNAWTVWVERAMLCMEVQSHIDYCQRSIVWIHGPFRCCSERLCMEMQNQIDCC